MPTPTTRVATWADLPAICEFLNTVFVPRSMEDMTHKFTPPEGFRDVPPGWLAEVDGRIVGFYGTLAWQVIRDGQVLDIVQPCDVAVAEEYRGTGLYQRMYDDYRTHSELFGPLAFGFPGPQAAAIGISQMGYVMRAATVVMEYKGPRIADISDFFPSSVSLSVPNDWFPYVTNAAAAMGVTSNRTKAFYEWRFRATDKRKYCFITVYKDGAVVGVAVVRYFPTDSTRPVIIFDLLADTDAARQKLLSIAGLDVLPFAGQPLYHGATTNAPYLSQLESLGFVAGGEGVMVTSIIGPGDAQVPPEYIAMHNTDAWGCSFTDTDE